MCTSVASNLNLVFIVHLFKKTIKLLISDLVVVQWNLQAAVSVATNHRPN